MEYNLDRFNVLVFQCQVKHPIMIITMHAAFSSRKYILSTLAKYFVVSYSIDVVWTLSYTMQLGMEYLQS